MTDKEHRPLQHIAADIFATWGPKGQGVYFGAKPYLEAMLHLGSISEPYGADSGSSIVRYFLANANTFRGPDARALKAELRAMLP